RAQRRHSLALETEASPRLAAFRHLYAAVIAVDGRHLDLAAERGKHHGDRHPTMQIRALTLEERMCANGKKNVEVAGRPAALARAAAPTPAAAHAEEVVEDIGEGGRNIAKAASGTGTGMLERGMTKAVISSALVRILENFVRFVDLLEANFRSLIGGIAIGMPLHPELAEGGFQFTFVRRAPGSQHFVIAALGHASVPPIHLCRGITAGPSP